MRKTILVFCFWLTLSSTFGQNLVDNSSFENVSAEPFYGCEFTNATGWLNPSGAPCPANLMATPDLFSTFSTGQAVLPSTFMGTTQPHTGNRIAGLVTYHLQLVNYREYFMTEFLCPMTVGQTYTVSFWSTGGNPVQYIYHSNNIEVYFHNTPLTQSNYSVISGITPHLSLTNVIADTTWTLYSFQFTPTQPYTYMSIGNFKTDANTTVQTFGANRPYAYYFFDDITVKPTAVSNFLGNDTAYCPNFSRVLTSGDPTTNWSTGANGSQITINSPGTYIATIASRCGTVADTVVIAQLPSPQVDLGNDTSFCNGLSVVLNAAAPNATYQWQNGSTSSSYTVNAAGTYSVTVTAANQCTASDAVNVTVNNIQLSVTAVNTTCGLANGLAIANVSNGAAPYTYLWSNGATTDSIQNISGGTYSVTVQDNNGCIMAGSAAVNPSGNGAVTITSDQLIQCALNTATICAPTGYIGYLWNTGATTNCISATLPGNYYVTVTDNANCTSSSNVIALQQLPVPSISTSVSDNTITVYNTQQRAWFRNGVLIVGATDSVYTVTQTGTYTVMVTDSNGCAASSNPVSFTIVGLQDLAETAFSVFPNPTKGVVQINYKTGHPFDVVVSDLQGRLIDKQVNLLHKVSLNFTSMEKGIYFLKLRDTETGTETTQNVMVGY